MSSTGKASYAKDQKLHILHIFLCCLLALVFLHAAYVSADSFAKCGSFFETVTDAADDTQPSLAGRVIPLWVQNDSVPIVPFLHSNNIMHLLEQHFFQMQREHHENEGRICLSLLLVCLLIIHHSLFHRQTWGHDISVTYSQRHILRFQQRQDGRKQVSFS